MESGGAMPSISLVQCCDCACNCSMMKSGTWIRTVKRKLDEFEESNVFSIPDFPFPQIARVEIENECEALRDIVSSQQETIQELSLELEEERNASSSAANETMAMILRLQREKAEIQLETRQFKRFAEEKMAHDQEELSAMDELLYKREQSIQSLYCEIQSYKHRMMSYGLTESEADGGRGGMIRNDSLIEFGSQFDLPIQDYPPLKCNFNENHVGLEVNNDIDDVEKYAFGESPTSLDHLKDIEFRIDQLERSPKKIHTDGDFSGNNNVYEKVIVGQFPSLHGHLRRSSTDKSISLSATSKETGLQFVTEPLTQSDMHNKKSVTEEEPIMEKVEYKTNGADDMNDRVYTIDSVHQGGTGDCSPKLKSHVGVFPGDMITPKESLNETDLGDPEIKKLYLRLQALEADRESMRNTIISMRTDKVQLVLLKEIAQHLCNEMSPVRRVPVKKPLPFGTISIVPLIKWVVSFVLWRRKKTQSSKYNFGSANSGSGLLMLLDKAPKTRQWRSISSIQV
ncbi:myosin-binding protein 7-like [Impatiens glandulifera]|uniref:myosin-binding protein 7-like n=1 Tax=Impatiens glandulifera TaxID=253017 RepID=UPI001FB0FFF7|nr:myosin-binding protein 7-like [Impatiens glandulifera]XP_047331453.1 myosin-binding protein 7-like [Impatiens glandulifera]